jgi:hypothetical protein
VAAADARDPQRLASAIRTIYPVRYVVVHENLGGGRTWHPMIGGRGDLRGTSGWSHVLVGTRGATAGEAVEDWGPRATSILIGKDRRLGVTLEGFDLL